MAGLINDDWDGLCDVKLLINDKEHSCNFTPSQLHLECILLLAATAKPSNPVHRGVFPGQKAGLVIERHKHETSARLTCLVGWQAAPRSTGSS